MALPIPYYQDESVTIYNADCRDILPSLPKVDLVLTDPPYNASFDKDGKPRRGIVCKSKGYEAIQEAWDNDISIEVIASLLDMECLAFCSHHLLRRYLELRQPTQILHWHKPNSFPALADYYSFSIEYILWWHNGGCFNKEFAGRDILIHPICGGGERTEHPTQKPEEIFQKLILVHSNPTQLILDPFMGSGTTLRAAKDLGRKAIGIEIKEKYCEIAAKRMSQSVLGLESPIESKQERIEQSELAL